jgi:hypothetical protein
VRAMKVYRGSRRIAPLILNLGTRRRYGHPHAPAALLLGKEPRCPLNMRLGGPQSRFGLFGEDKNVLFAPGFERRTVQTVGQSLNRSVMWHCLSRGQNVLFAPGFERRTVQTVGQSLYRSAMWHCLSRGQNATSTGSARSPELCGFCWRRLFDCLCNYL